MRRFGNSIEELSIKKINSRIKAIQRGMMSPEEARVGYFLNKLQALNEAMYDELLNKYIQVKRAYDEKNSVLFA
jgi:hypothetical protein